jgi:hypothetical protein
LPPTLQIKKKKEKDLYPPLNSPKTKGMNLYSSPINKKKWTMQSSTVIFLYKKNLVPTPQPSKEQTKERFTPTPTLQVFKKT